MLKILNVDGTDVYILLCQRIEFTNPFEYSDVSAPFAISYSAGIGNELD